MTLLLLAASAAAQEPEDINYPDDPFVELKNIRGTNTNPTSDLAPSGDYQGFLFNSAGWSNSFNGNIITVTGGDTINYIYGTYYQVSATTTYPVTPPALPDVVSGNWIFFNAGTQSDGEMHGARVSISNISSNITTLVKDNHVHISGGTISPSLISGGCATARGISVPLSEVRFTARENSITIEGDSTVSQLVGGDVAIDQAQTAYADASGNKITISDMVTVQSNFRGGYAQVNDSENAYLTASDNTIILKDQAKAGNEIVGGYAQVLVATDTIKVTVANNKVYIQNQAELSSTDVIGGFIHVRDSNLSDTPTADTTITSSNNKVFIGGGSKECDRRKRRCRAFPHCQCFRLGQ